MTSIPSPVPSQTPVASPSAIRNIGSILYLAPDGHTLRRIRPDGTGDALVATIPKGISTTVSLSVSPDGTSMVALRYRDNIALDASFLVHQHTVTLLDIPWLEHIHWSPDSTSFVGTIVYTTTPQYGELYVYNLLKKKGHKLPVRGIADWGATNKTLIIATISQMIKREQYSEPLPTYDLYRYIIATDKQERLSHLDQAIIEFPRGHGTDNWSISDIRTVPNQNKILFQGVPEYLKPGAGANTSSWYSIPIDGLEREKKPTPILFANGAILYNPANAAEMMSSGSRHNSYCSNPGYIVMQRPATPTAIQLYVPLPLPENAEPDVLGVAYAPDGQQIAYGANYYDCSQFEPHYSETAKIYIWDVLVDFNVKTYHAPRMLVEGSYPVWVADGSR